jgi:hypothetical protein
MKNIVLKNTITAISLLLAIGYVESVSAHTQSGTLGSAAGATDLYQVLCSPDASPTAKLTSRVRTGTAVTAVKVSVRTQKGVKATNSTDNVNGDAISSPSVSNASGDGIYFMTVGKTVWTKVAVPYTLDFHCQSSAGEHTGTDWFTLQNQ